MEVPGLQCPSARRNSVLVVINNGLAGPLPVNHASQRRIALGIEDLLDDFARDNAAETWKQFSRADPTQWKSDFLDTMNDPNSEVLFNLKGVDVWRGVTRASSGKGGATDWELLQIMQNGPWWPRTQWIRDGVTVQNPFE